MDPITIAALVAGGVSLVGSGVNAGVNLNQNRKTREWQEEMYKKYYSPMSQMEQMTAAGINPNLAAQGISGSPGISMPQASNSNNPMNLDVNGAINAYNSVQLADAEVKNKNADTSVKETIAEGNTIENEVKKQTFDDVVNGIKAENKEKAYKAELLRPYAEHADQWYKVNFDQLNEKVNLLRKQQDEIDEQIKNLAKQRDVMESEIGANQAQAWYNNEMAKLQQRKNELWDSLGADDVETAYIRAKVEGDDKKANDIKDGVEAYVKAEKQAEEEAKQGVKNEENPEQAWEKKLYEDLQKDLKPLDDEISGLKKELDDYSKGRRKDNYFKTHTSELKYRLKSAENKRKNLLNDYNENLRRRKSNSHVNIGPVGVTN